MKRTGAIAVAAIALSVLARPVMAQLPAVPNYPVETGTLITVQGDYAQPNSDLGGGTAYGIMGGIGFSRFGLRAAVGAWEPDNFTSSQTSYGAAIGMRLIGGGLNPFSVGAQVGASQVEFGATKVTSVLPGVYARFSPPLFPIKPFGQVYYQTGDNVTEETRVTLGANLNLLLGFGFHGAYDYGDSGTTWGVGAHFTFRVPGVGVPGM